jgi:formylglycine-generating enzyme required for sulfatase activity
MVALPSGRFFMGSPETEHGRCPGYREGPQRLITIPRSFALATTPVTRNAFRRFADDTGFERKGIVIEREPGVWGTDIERSALTSNIPQDDDHPVVGIGWEDARAFADWLSKNTSRAYRLPSEAEWEYAARAETTSPFWWGDAIGPDNANCDHRHGFAGRPSIGGWLGTTCPVERYAPNPWGLFQMPGNVWEWCADDFSNNLSDVPADGSPLRGNSAESPKSLRGGSFLNGPWNLRSANRMGDPPGFRHVSFGFRLACDL